MNLDMDTTDPTAAFDDEGSTLSLLDILTWLGEGKKFIGIITVLAGAIGLIVALLTPNMFTARTTLLQPSSQQSGSAAALAALGSLGGLAGSLGSKAADELYVGLLKTDTLRRDVAQQFDLNKRYQTKNFEALKKEMTQRVRVSSDKKSGLILIEVDDEDPPFAAQLANAHAEQVLKLLSRLAVSEAQKRRMFFEQQLKDTKENLIQAEQQLRSVQEKSGMVVLDKQAGAIIEALAQLKTRIAEREIKLKVLRTNTTAENPDAQLLSAELAALRSELTRMESTARVDSKENAAGMDTPIGQLPGKAIDHVRALREVKFQESMLGSMLKQFEIAKLDEAKDAPALQQVDVAVAPDQKSKPHRAFIIGMAFLMGLILACAVVIWRRFHAWAQSDGPEKAQAMRKLLQAWRFTG
jgi:tyrosine-protein kinase Etk/Wzc